MQIYLFAVSQVIRELSEDRENAEQEGVDEKTRVLQTELESARDELERLREDRGRQMTMVEAVVRQRDMYRVLLAQNPEVQKTGNFREKS